MFKPILELKELILKHLIKPPRFISKIAEYANEIAEAISNPIEYILNELIEPISENINIPLSLDLSALLPGFKVNVDKGFLKLPKELQELINKMLSQEYFDKLLEFILFPIKLMTGMFEALAKLIAQALASPVAKIPQLVIDFTANFVNGVIGLITDLLGSILEPIFNSIVPGGFENINKLISDVKEMIVKALTGKLDIEFVKKKRKESKDFDKVFGFINIIICFMKAILVFIVMFPTAFFGAGAGEAVESAQKASEAVEIIKNDYKKPVKDKVNDINKIKRILRNSELSSSQITTYRRQLAKEEDKLLELKEEVVETLQSGLDRNGIQKVIDEDKTVFVLLNLNARKIVNYKL
jgi:hypothetical protein